MHNFSFEPTPIAEWYALLQEAKSHTGYDFHDNIENYLVLTLDSYINNNNISSGVLAMDFLRSIETLNNQEAAKLRDVGDQCLLLSGLFPERAIKKNVSLDYFISMGQQAYNTLSSASLHLKLDTELFYWLSFHFVALMDILTAMRKLPKPTQQ